MDRVKINDVEVDLYDKHTPIGVSLSGGADSALLAYILMKYSKAPIHFFTLGSKEKNFITTKHSTDVINTCIELTNNLNIVHYVEYVNIQEREYFFKLLIDKVNSSMVKVMYTATTSIPSTTDLENFKNKLKEDIAARRNPSSIKPIHSHGNKLYHPFLNINKKDIKKMYNELGILNNLFPKTRSCESLTNFQNHCGKCWWCEERFWAFGCLE
jgi:hypothetical protein